LPVASRCAAATRAWATSERSGAKLSYVVAGAAAGFAWWIKPNAAVPFALVFVGYALWRRTWRREWNLVVAAAMLVAGAELLMYWVVFNDPLFGLSVLLKTFRKTYVVSDLTWQSNSPWFYFRQFFIDGREAWLLPYFALSGMWLLARSAPATMCPTWNQYMLFWLVALIGVFSFMIISVSPLKFIPKQENYASMFLAPMAIVAGCGLAHLRQAALAFCLVIFAGGACVLAGIESQRIALHYSTLAKTVEFSRRHPDAEIWVSSQATSSGYLANLMTRIAARPGNLSMIQPSAFAGTLQLRSTRERFVIVDPTKPEFLSAERRAQWQQLLNRCWQRFEQLSPESSGFGATETTTTTWLRHFLPAAIDRHLRFTDDLIDPQPATVYRMAPGAGCPDAQG
jgi:hypothetical protein